MIRSIFRIIKIAILIAVVLFESTYSQLLLKLNTEAGCFLSDGSEYVSHKDFLSRVEGLAEYGYENNDFSAAINIKARPEVYGFDGKLRSLKVKTAGSVSFNQEKYLLGFSGHMQKHFYDIDGYKINYNIFTAQSDLTYYSGEETAINICAGYSYYKITDNDIQKQNIFFFESSLNGSLSSKLFVGPGLYLEKFYLSNEYESIQLHDYSSSFNSIKNSGVKYGALIKAGYSGNYSFNSEYRFLFCESDFTRSWSYEQSIKLAAGTIFLKGWSAFILGDYYLRNFNLTDSAKLNGDLDYYAPVNNDNNIYLKIARELNDNMEIYTKAGFSKENFSNKELSISTWNILVGFELKN